MESVLESHRTRARVRLNSPHVTNRTGNDRVARNDARVRGPPSGVLCRERVVVVAPVSP